MKKLFLLALIASITFSLHVFAGITSEKNEPDGATTSLQPHSVGEIVKHAGYSLAYSEFNEQAIWVYYKLSAKMLSGHVSRTDDFRPDVAVKSGSATLVDYKASGYDRGHLCPAGDMVQSKQTMSESFFMSNMSPQVPGFNRGIWKNLEAKVRGWAKMEQEIYVVTGPIFRDNKGKIGQGVTIPGYYYKVIYDPTGDKKMIALILPNEKSDNELETFVVPVDKVEELTGVDFFPGLPDALENKLEASSNISKWQVAAKIASQAKSTTAKSQKAKSNYAVSKQCLGRTKDRLRCKNLTRNANGYCHLHKPKNSE